jgi:hypothetical protein
MIRLRGSDGAGAVLRCQFRCHLTLDEVSDQAACSFDKRELVGKAALKQYADAVMSGRVGRGDKRDVLAYAEMNQMIRLGQDIQVPCQRRLDLGQLSPAVLEENFLKTSAKLHRLLADELEALIELLEDPLGHEYSCFKRLLYVRILHDLAELLKYLGGALCALSNVAEHHDEQLFGIFYCHVDSFVIFFFELPAPPELTFNQQ